MALCIDSVTPAAIPKGTPVVAGYIDGPYSASDPAGWTAAAWKSFPGSQMVTITVHGTPGAKVYDIETGDGTPAQGAAWALAEIRAGRRPTLYANASTWAAELDPSLHAVGLSRVSSVDGWVAQYNDKAIVPAGFVAHQYLANQKGVQGSYIDYSVTDGVWPGSAPVPTPTPPPPTPQGEFMQSPVVSFKASQLDVLQVSAGTLWHKWFFGGVWQSENVVKAAGQTATIALVEPQWSQEVGLNLVSVEDTNGSVWVFQQAIDGITWGANKLP